MSFEFDRITLNNQTYNVPGYLVEGRDFFVIDCEELRKEFIRWIRSSEKFNYIEVKQYSWSGKIIKGNYILTDIRNSEATFVKHYG